MVDQFEGFVPIHTIFYAVFHPTEGTKVRYEFPPGNLESHNINFDTIKNYIIPKPQLCHKLLTLKYKNYRIASYPVTVNSSIYARNFFSFNFVFVFRYDCETSPYEPAIARLGKMFKVLEEQNLILSKAEKDPVYFQCKSADTVGDQDGKLVPEKGSQKPSKGQNHFLERYNRIMKEIERDDSNFSLRDLVLRIYQDLNNYSECLIPIDEGNAVDIKIFPLMTPPHSSISIDDVPVSTVNLQQVIDVNWDPTMLKIVPFIDGLNSISKIAKLSDSDQNLVIECIKHLIYYNCVLLVDIFQFSNIYAPTSLLRTFLTDPVLATECQDYVVCEELSHLPRFPFKKTNILETESIDQESLGPHGSKRNSGSRTTSMSSRSEVSSQPNKITLNASATTLYRTGKHSQSSFSSNNTNHSNMLVGYLPTKSCLFDLYRSLSQGVPLKDWYRANFSSIRNNRIDVRRFISFGVIKGLIYRCYSYPIMKNLEIFDLAKRLNTDEGSTPMTSSNKNSKTPHNIFSTSDIRFGGDDNERNKKQRQALDLDIADEVLRNVYKKLSIADNPGMKTGPSNPMSRLYRDSSSQGSMSDSSMNNVYRIKRSERPSKVSFDRMHEAAHTVKYFPSQNEKSRNDEKAKLKQKKKRELLLLESVETADSLEKICVKLEISRHEAEDLLKTLGEYRIINS